MSIKVNKNCIWIMVLLVASIWNLGVQIENSGNNIGFAIAGIVIAVIWLIIEWRKEIKSDRVKNEELEP